MHSCRILSNSLVFFFIHCFISCAVAFLFMRSQLPVLVLSPCPMELVQNILSYTQNLQSNVHGFFQQFQHSKFQTGVSAHLGLTFVVSHMALISLFCVQTSSFPSTMVKMLSLLKCVCVLYIITYIIIYVCVYSIDR